MRSPDAGAATPVATAAPPFPRIPEMAPPYRAAAIGAGLALSGAALVHFGPDPRGFVAAGFVAVLVLLAAIDAEHRLIPNRIVLPATAVLLALQLAFFGEQAAQWLIAGLGAPLTLLLPTLIKPGSLGMGDVKLAALLGVGLGSEVVNALVFGSLAALPVAIWILARRGAAARKETIPLGPFLAAGGILALFAGSSL